MRRDEEPIVQIEVDESRNAMYTRTDKGGIQVNAGFDLPNHVRQLCVKSVCLFAWICYSFKSFGSEQNLSAKELFDTVWSWSMYLFMFDMKLQVYTLGAEDASKVAEKTSNSISNTAAQILKTVDKSNFENIIHIAIIDKSESLHLHLVAITAAGVLLLQL